ncbi:hypothetical protein JTB14_032836 [Gonioctena quinquepunctata]|nr:hypothetical protein JTB14_032836 [Gonioctena quinquepunctata]
MENDLNNTIRCQEQKIEELQDHIEKLKKIVLICRVEQMELPAENTLKWKKFTDIQDVTSIYHREEPKSNKNANTELENNKKSRKSLSGMPDESILIDNAGENLEHGLKQIETNIVEKNKCEKLGIAEEIQGNTLRMERKELNEEELRQESESQTSTSASEMVFVKVVPELFKDNPHLSVMLNSPVTKIIFDKHKTAIGVEVVYKGVTYTVRARKQIILAAVAFVLLNLLAVSVKFDSLTKLGCIDSPLPGPNSARVIMIINLILGFDKLEEYRAQSPP